MSPPTSPFQSKSKPRTGRVSMYMFSERPEETKAGRAEKRNPQHQAVCHLPSTALFATERLQCALLLVMTFVSVNTMMC